MTTICAPQRQTHRPPAAVRKAKREAQRQADQLTDQIMTGAQQQEVLAKAAAALTQGYLTQAEVLAWQQQFNTRLDALLQHSEQNLGFAEEELAPLGNQLLRLGAERLAQAKANATPCRCSQCDLELHHQKYLSRRVDSRFGPLLIFRRYGQCPDCKQWHFPADHALGLQANAPASPYVQEISAVLVTKMPPEQACAVAQRLGLDLGRCFLDREAHRQGLKAQAARAVFTAQLDSLEGLQELPRGTDGPPIQPFTLVIEIDAWNIRERDDWGLTEQLRREGEDHSRWHWVYMGTVFRLDHCGQTAGQRAFISQRGYVATRLGIEDLLRQLYREALERGLAQAQDVLVLADGAVWIWNVFQDRFKDARQRLDLWHAEEHLWEVANDLYGKSTPEARAFVTPLLQQLREDQTVQLIQSLTDLESRLQGALSQKVQKQIDYFSDHKNRMHYKELIEARKARDAGTATPKQLLKAQEPLGSGAIESTCRQYQCRFKRTGQFWTTDGDEALMCLETFWRNDRWHVLYPHVNHLKRNLSALN
jgi:hypothetical protein